MNLEELKKRALEGIESAATAAELAHLKLHYLGKKGKITQLIKSLPKLPPDERKILGREINTLKTVFFQVLEKKISAFPARPAGGRFPSSAFPLDLTLPGHPYPCGYLHPVSQAIFEIEEIFFRLGFLRRRYGEVETDYYNFEALNIPKDHPARDEQETFYLGEDLVLTTHTSNGQIHELERGELPVRMINISKCYRRQSDITHTPTFHQFEGLLVDKGVSITDLKGTIDYFVRSYFGQKAKFRLRPYNFRFTEPSLEVDISCTVCQGEGCPTCKDGWLELAGAGMVHPQVLKNCKVDAEKYSGFAFGFGVERCFMVKHQISDLRLLYSSDLRVLQQF